MELGNLQASSERKTRKRVGFRNITQFCLSVAELSYIVLYYFSNYISNISPSFGNFTLSIPLVS